jgi:peptide deformylase
VRSFRGRDILAQVFQHELNHLDGILIDTLVRRAQE